MYTTCTLNVKQKKPKYVAPWKKKNFKEPGDTLSLVESWMRDGNLPRMDGTKLTEYLSEARAVREIYRQLYADPFVLKTKEAVRAEYLLPAAMSKPFAEMSHEPYSDQERTFAFCCVGMVRERRGVAVIASFALKPRGKHGLQDRIKEFMLGIVIPPLPK